MQPRGSEIRRLRQELGIGLRSFAGQVSVSPAHLSRIERGERRAQPEVLKRIADGLGTGIGDISQELEGKQ